MKCSGNCSRGNMDPNIACTDIISHKGSSHKLNAFNWLKDIPGNFDNESIIEIRFKNTRKEFYRNVNNLRLEINDVVAVEASPGHDIGIVSLTGELVLHKLNQKRISHDAEFKKIYRKAKPADIEKWNEAIALEDSTMIRARKLASNLKLNMKIGDVEFQGDKTKAIFYYIAEERVDFRELIKLFAEEFKIRIEMRQIGARQEAGRIGGIGPCGRELCCTTWITNFVSVTTNSARQQELSLNPQKLAGQCGKLKCCLNYELATYVNARKEFPDTSIPLQTKDGNAIHQKTDVFKKTMWYSVSNGTSSKTIVLSVNKVKEIQELNKKGIKCEELFNYEHIEKNTRKIRLDYENSVGQESLTRFDSKKKKKKKKKRRKPKFRQNGTN